MIFCGSVIGVFSFQREISETYRETEEHSQEYIQLIAAQTTQVLTDLNRENHVLSTKAGIISQLGNDPQLQLIAVLDHQNIIQEANDFSLQEKPLSQTEIVEYLEYVEATRKTISGDVFFVENRNRILAFYPFFLERLPSELKPSRVGILFLKYDLTDAKRVAFNNALRRTVFANSLLILFYIGLWSFFELALTRRISKLVNASNDLAKGNLNVRTGLMGSDELVQVSAAFDFMAQKIQEKTNNLETELIEKEKIYKKLEKRNQELSSLNEKLEQATKAKADFLANMSHEIRTPMNGVLGIAQLLETTDLSRKQRDLVMTIRDSGDTLLTIINDILDFSKIESGKLTLEFQPVVWDEVVQSAINLLSTQVQKKKLWLTYESSIHEFSAFEGDAVRLRQILLNLLGNAVKFTTSGGVAISTSAICLDGEKESEEKEYCITVKIQDSGIGIAGDRLAKLFQPFTQADESINRKYGGTGLGLVISKSLVELMGGTIWVNSKGNIAGSPPVGWHPEIETQMYPQEHGATFYFTFLATSVSDVNRQNATSMPLLKEHESFDFAQLKVLLAEDNRVNQKVMLLILGKLGVTVDIANNGVEVLDHLKKEAYDVILMDVQMPELDGISTTRLIREGSYYQPYIIALTANALESDRQASLEAGMNDFLTKPILIEQVIQAFANFLKKTCELAPEIE
ncbi:histidine kinase [[Leptolyngbya] sp. PCC 7376]|nr:histidine kinase [[Leptolyngbya] sp. PCC 7376]